jgi:DNA-directed RNA polymerase sigma subunit (sigma70/sigma32)
VHDGRQSNADIFEDEQLRQAIRDEVQRLIPKELERRAVILYYGLDGKEPMTLVQVSEALGKYTHEGIRLILRRCRKKLAKSKLLKDFVAS